MHPDAEHGGRHPDLKPGERRLRTSCREQLGAREARTPFKIHELIDAQIDGTNPGAGQRVERPARNIDGLPNLREKAIIDQGNDAAIYLYGFDVEGKGHSTHIFTDRPIPSGPARVEAGAEAVERQALRGSR